MSHPSRNDLFVLDTLTLTWSHPQTTGAVPSRRRAHTTALHKGRIILFGGGNGASALNDTFALDVSDLTKPLVWERLDTRGREGAGVPPPRGYHTMNLVGDKVVVFGGSDGTECFSDVWALDLGEFVSPGLAERVRVGRMLTT